MEDREIDIITNCLCFEYACLWQVHPQNNNLHVSTYRWRYDIIIKYVAFLYSEIHLNILSWFRHLTEQRPNDIRLLVLNVRESQLRVGILKLITKYLQEKYVLTLTVKSMSVSQVVI